MPKDTCRKKGKGDAVDCDYSPMAGYSTPRRPGMIVLPTFLLGHAGDALVGALLSLLGVQGLDDASHRAVDACNRVGTTRTACEGEAE